MQFFIKALHVLVLLSCCEFLEGISEFAGHVTNPSHVFQDAHHYYPCNELEKVDLTFIFSGRNDAHSGGFMSRLFMSLRAIEIFGWTDYGVRVEVLIICWNENVGDTSLASMLVPQLFASGQDFRARLRFVHVPPHLHEGFANPGNLPFLQYNARNVGMRVACGKFLVMMNADNIMSLSLSAAVVNIMHEDVEIQGRFFIASRWVTSYIPLPLHLPHPLHFPCRLDKSLPFLVLSPEAVFSINASDFPWRIRGNLFKRMQTQCHTLNM